MAMPQSWETAVFDSDIYKYLVPTSNVPNNWNTVGFNDASWNSGKGGFGYGDGDDSTVVSNGTISVFIRKNFTVVDKTKLKAAILSMDYDDGFVAYLNGVEIARSNNVSGTPDFNITANNDHEADMYNGGNPTNFTIDSTILSNALQNGNNVLCVSAHNTNASSSDLTLRPFLHFGIADASIFYSTPPSWFNLAGGSNNLHTNFALSFGEKITLFNISGAVIDSISIPFMRANHVRCRVPDGGNWCLSDTATPNTPNNVVCYSGYAAEPVFNVASGFYASPQSISISGNNIHYTIDGNEPKVTNTTYSNPINVGSNQVIRAVNFEAGKLPSNIVSQSYFINEVTQLPIVSITANPGDLFNGFGGPAWYDNAPYGGGAPKVPCHVAYFDKAKNFQFGENASFAVVGNFSTAFSQKPMQFKFDEEWNAKGDVPNTVFTKDKPGIKRLKGFRVRNMDDDYTDARMRDIIANRMSKGTASAYAGYQNVAVYINGQYWGHYGAREILNEDFCADNFGSNTDDIDLLKTRITNSLEVEKGSSSDFLSLVNYMNTNTVSNQSIYDSILNRIDVKNWVDYYANQIFNANEDWFPSIYYNNTEFFTSRNPKVKWKYIQWDQAYGMYNCNFDLLNTVINDPNNATHSQMFNRLLTNNNFKNYFINRFADLINTNFSTTYVHHLIDSNAAEIISEIPKQYARWGSASPQSPSPSYWQSSVNNLKGFYVCRPATQRNHIESQFNLAGQVNITLQVSPTGAGHIKISSIIPENLPWTGVYFNGVPVTITAIANPGYTFNNWNTNAFITNTSNAAFTNTISANTTFTANFNGSAIPNPIVVSEINYNSDGGKNTGDWIELYNPSSSSIDLSNYKLQTEKFYQTFEVPTGTILSSNSRLVLKENSTAFNTWYAGIANTIGDFNFGLDNSGDSIILKNNVNETFLKFRYNDATPWPQCADGFGRTLEFLNGNPNLSTSWKDGCMLGSPGSAFTTCNEGDIIFNEINYKSSTTSDAGDWIELYNKGPQPINISAWQLRDDKNLNPFVMPINTIIPSGGFLTIASDLNKFSTIHPATTNVVGPFLFGLSNNGEVVRLYDNSGKIQLSLYYNSVAPWPTNPNGGGSTLELIQSNLELNDGSNWQQSCPDGSPSDTNRIGALSNCLLSISSTFNSNIKIFPNPSKGILNIDISNPVIATVYNQLGQAVIETKVDNKVDLSQLNAGIYFLKLRDLSTNQTYTYKVVKE
jgi:hypothetical protein